MRSRHGSAAATQCTSPRKSQTLTPRKRGRVPVLLPLEMPDAYDPTAHLELQQVGSPALIRPRGFVRLAAISH
jgi:hypothetical protein